MGRKSSANPFSLPAPCMRPDRRNGGPYPLRRRERKRHGGPGYRGGMAARRGRIAVIGAGAAGSMAAIFAAASGAETILIERTPDGGRKILISGGGRCNVLPARSDESRFVTASPARALQRMLRSWPLREQIPFFEGALG